MIPEIPADRASLVADIDAAYEAIAAWNERLRKLKADLFTVMGDADEIEYQGEIVARYAYARKPGTFDRKKLEHDHPEIHRAYWHESNSLVPRFTWRPTRAGARIDYR